MSDTCQKIIVLQSSLRSKILFLILKLTERQLIVLKNDTRYFQNSLLFERLACFYVTITGTFKRFKYFIFEANFLKNAQTFSWSIFLKLEYLD